MSANNFGRNIITFAEDNSHLGNTENKDNIIMVLSKRYLEERNFQRSKKKIDVNILRELLANNFGRNMITFVEDNSHLGHTEKKDNNIMVLIKRYVEKQNASREPRKENLFDYTLQL